MADLLPYGLTPAQVSHVSLTGLHSYSIVELRKDLKLLYNEIETFQLVFKRDFAVE